MTDITRYRIPGLCARTTARLASELGVPSPLPATPRALAAAVDEVNRRRPDAVEAGCEAVARAIGEAR